MDELQSGPLMVNSLTGRFFVVERTHVFMWNNEIKISDFIGETILDG
jgi:hypothetical protein